MKALASFIMRGRMQGILVASVFSLVIVLSSFQAGGSSLITMICGILMAAVIALVTLRKGSVEGLVTLAGASAASTVLSLIVMQNVDFSALALFVIMVLPVWGLALLLRRTVSLSSVLSAAVAIGVLGVIGIYVVFDDPAAQWYKMLSMSIGNQLSDPNLGMFDADEIETYLNTLAGWMTGLMVAAIVSTYLTSLLVGRWWQALLYNPGGFKEEFYGVRVGRNIGITAFFVFVGALLGSGLLSNMMSDMLWLFSFVYLIPGIAIAHSVITLASAPKPLFVVFYVFLAILPQIAIFMALVGWADTWFNFREKLIKNSSSSK